MISIFLLNVAFVFVDVSMLVESVKMWVLVSVKVVVKVVLVVVISEVVSVVIVSMANTLDVAVVVELRSSKFKNRIEF